MMAFPPGPIYLVRNFRGVGFVAVVGLLFNFVFKAFFHINPPTWLVLLVSVLSLPFALSVKVQLGDYVAARNAASCNAQLPPAVKSKLIGGIDIIREANRNTLGLLVVNPFLKWSEQYGNTFSMKIMFQNRVFTAEPDYIKSILATDFANFEKGPAFKSQMQTILGTGVFNSDGDMWKFHRAMTRPFFSKDRISHFDIFDKHATAAIELMRARLSEGHAVDWQDLASRFTLDSATDFLFGQDVMSLAAGLPYPPTSPLSINDPSEFHPASRFAKEFLIAQETSGKRGRYAGAWPLVEFWKDKVRSHMSVVDEFIDPLLKKALEEKVTRSGTDKTSEISEDDTVLSHLVNLTDDPKIIKDETLNILIAGRDTTAALLTFAVYQLSEHLDILARLRQEILTKVGRTRRPDYDDIRDMKYLRAVINETLRLYPSVPFNVRTSINPTIWRSTKPGQKDYYIPANTRCIYSVFAMQRRKDLWGPDALEFDPDRFLDERLHKYLTPNPFIFLPFNAGPRICLGQQFAYNEASFMLVRLLQQFSTIELQPNANPAATPAASSMKSNLHTNGKERVIYAMNLTANVKNGLWVKMGDAPKVECV